MTEIRTVADPRVVTETGVVMNQYVGPLNWEHYKIPASGLSNTQITFANLVTLGANRIYDSGFHIEYTLEMVFTMNPVPVNPPTAEDIENWIRFHPFPLHWVTDQLRCNINGAACMTRPQESLPQRMMYWRQHVLDRSCSYCPHTKAPSIMDAAFEIHADPDSFIYVEQSYFNHQRKYGKNGSQNVGSPLPCVSFTATTAGANLTVKVTFREPILCPPFNQRLDKVYQSPLYNITSIDIVYQLNNLRAMLEASYCTYISDDSGLTLDSAVMHSLSPANISSINITSAQLCFNVASLPNGMTVPASLTLPYYDNVCYVTDAAVPSGTTGDRIITSGVYTLAQVPTAIYIFVGPNQLYRSSGQVTGSCLETGYCPIRDINITMGNNTQLLNTTSEFDRYQMAIANGLEDVSWEEFTRSAILMPHTNMTNVRTYTQGQHGNKCILRLIPGVDLLIPDKRLVGGSDAEQMVFQVRLTADVTGIPNDMQTSLALWIMFEYCGVLTIEPVHAAIDMLPIKAVPPITGIDVVPDTTVTNAEGGGEGTVPVGAGLFGNFLRKIPSLLGKAINKIREWGNSDIVQGVGSAILGVADPTGLANPMIGALRSGLDNLAARAPPTSKPRITGSGFNDDDDDDMEGGDVFGGSIIGSGRLGKFYT